MKRIALAAAPLLLAAATFSPAASADHGHNCVWSGGAWIGQGLCPGMPGFEWHGPEPTPEPTSTQTSTPTVTTPAPTITTPAPTQTPTPTTPTPSSSPTSTAAPTPTGTPTTSCVWSGGEFIGQGDPRDCPRPALPRATPSTSTTTPAPVVGPLVETDIVLYAPEVNPARILR